MASLQSYTDAVANKNNSHYSLPHRLQAADDGSPVDTKKRENTLWRV
jgi:hypothetical protein